LPSLNLGLRSSLALVPYEERAWAERRQQARTDLVPAAGSIAIARNDAIADCEKAVAKAADYGGEGSRIELFQESQMRLNGQYKEAIALLEEWRKD
jgi:hypothetical protein